MPGPSQRSRSPRRCLRATSRRRIRVAVALEAPLDREGLLALIRTQSDLQPVGGAGTLPEALALCLTHRPQVLLLSTLLGDPREVPASAVIRLAAPETRIVGSRRMARTAADSSIRPACGVSKVRGRSPTIARPACSSR